MAAVETVVRFQDYRGVLRRAAAPVVKRIPGLAPVLRRIPGLAGRAPEPAPGPPVVLRGNLDAPAEAVLQRDTVLFRGWALAGSVSPAAVTVVVNRGRRVDAVVGTLRPDVPAYLNEPSSTPLCGWSAAVDLAGEPPGDLTIQVVVSHLDHHEVVADRLFALRGDGLTGSIDMPLDGSEIPGTLLAVRGWAHAVDGVARIDVYVDGEHIGPARIGLARPDVHDMTPAKYGVALGWERRCVLDEAAPPSHELAVTVTDRRGQTARLAGLTFTTRGHAISESDAELVPVLQERTGRAIAAIPDGRTSTGPGRDILVFSHSLAIGGGQLYLQDLLRGLVPDLTRCRVISAEGGILADELEDLGAGVSVNPRSVPNDIAGYEGVVGELAGFIRASGCTSVLLNTIGPWFAADAAHRAGIPTIWAIHESFALADWLNLGYGGRVLSPYVVDRVKVALQGATKMVFESDATRDLYVAEGVPAEVASTVLYGVDVDAIADYAAGRDRARDRADHGIPVDATVLLCMGVFEERKGQLWLAETFAELVDVHPQAVLVLVGDHPVGYADTVRRLVQLKGLGDRVRTVPITPDGWIWYSMADVLISASDIESLPRSFLEAMAFGCPVLSVSVFGVPELITDGETGWLMTPRDTRALLAGMHRVLGLSDETRRAVGAAGRDLVRESYRVDGYVGVYLDLIDEVEAFTPPAPPTVRTPSAPADSGVDG